MVTDKVRSHIPVYLLGIGHIATPGVAQNYLNGLLKEDRVLGVDGLWREFFEKQDKANKGMAYHRHTNILLIQFEVKYSNQ